jgi:hypothetical protein
MIYELRIYHMHPGRQKAICDRFQNHTLSIFPHHGIKVTEFWVDDEGAERIYYVCEFDSLAAKEKAWASFREDPEWARAKDESEQSGLIVQSVDSYVMRRAPFFG